MSRNDFVIIDAESKPFRVRLWGGKHWLFRWVNDRWVSSKELNGLEVDAWYPNALAPNLAKYYEAGVPFKE